MSAPTTPKPLNLTWAGAGLGVIVGVGISTLSFLVFMTWASADAAGSAAEANTGALWLFGALFCGVALIPAALVGGLTGAVMGTIYKTRPRRLSPMGATLLGAGIGGVVVLLSYLSVKGLVGSEEWETFLVAYGGGDTVFLSVLYALAVCGGFVVLSFQLNRRVPL